MFFLLFRFLFSRADWAAAAVVGGARLVSFDFTGFYLVIVSFYQFDKILPSFYWVLPSFIECYLVFTGSYGVLPSFNGFDQG